MNKLLRMAFEQLEQEIKEGGKEYIEYLGKIKKEVEPKLIYDDGKDQIKEV